MWKPPHSFSSTIGTKKRKTSRTQIRIMVRKGFIYKKDCNEYELDIFYMLLYVFLRLQDGGRLRRNSAHRISRSSKKVWKPSGHWIRRSLTKSRTKWSSMPIFLCHAPCNKKRLEHLVNSQPSRDMKICRRSTTEFFLKTTDFLFDCDNGFRTDEDSNGFFFSIWFLYSNIFSVFVLLKKMYRYCRL